MHTGDQGNSASKNACELRVLGNFERDVEANTKFTEAPDRDAMVWKSRTSLILGSFSTDELCGPQSGFR